MILQVFLEWLNLPPELRRMGHGFLGALYQSACAVRMPEAERFCQLPQRSGSQTSSEPSRHERGLTPCCALWQHSRVRRLSVQPSVTRPQPTGTP